MSEKRSHQRFQKHYEISFSLKDKPYKIFDMPLVQDISRSGLKFISSDFHPQGTKIIFNIRFPFLYPKETLIEGEVVEVVAVEAVSGAKTFKIRSRFINVSPPAAAALQQMEQFNLKNK